MQNGTFTFWACRERTDGTKEENSYSGVTASAMDENSVLWNFILNSSTKSRSSSSSFQEFGLACLEDNFAFENITIPEKGIYVLYQEAGGK